MIEATVHRKNTTVAVTTRVQQPSANEYWSTSISGDVCTFQFNIRNNGTSTTNNIVKAYVWLSEDDQNTAVLAEA